jgi:hypothetical protein
MLPKFVIILALLSVGLAGVNAKEAAAANEDVPKGPVNAPSQGKASAPQTNSKPAANSATGAVGGKPSSSSPSQPKK